MTQRDKLIEALEDKYFDLWMYDVAERDGKILEQRNLELERDPSATLPEELDEKCLALINTYFKNKHHTYKLRRIIKAVMIAALVSVLLFTTAFAFWEDFRISTLNLIIKVEEKYTSMTMGDSETDSLEEVIHAPVIEVGWVPEGFYRSTQSSANDCLYENDSGEVFRISSANKSANIHLDTENADEIETITDVSEGIEGIRVFKKGTITTAITNSSLKCFLIVWSSQGIEVKEHIQIFENVSIHN